ncbi:MAG TPA: alpha-glucosidase C-terminal domain-containing protein, partial [Mucilaginibacter sp.]|nr:alpha-glucosidase C-terminal domain-containing protein [Mucilaginibacter sp.]
SAFEWYKSDQGKGMAYWYKLKGPWKDKFNNDVPNDGISLQEEQNDPSSLWNFYRKMIALHQSNPVLIAGSYKTIENNNDQVYTFERLLGGKKVIIAVNLSGESQDAVIKANAPALKNLFGSIKPVISSGSVSASLPAYAIAVWEN